MQGISNLKALEVLEIELCKGIQNVSDIFELENLERLLLINCGEIESIKGIEKLTELREFFFYESTNILDGDLEPLTKLKKLSKMSFQNRRHYTRKREEFGDIYFGRD